MEIQNRAFAIADSVINKVYPDFNKKGKGFWGDERIKNYGILRHEIAKAILDERRNNNKNI